MFNPVIIHSEDDYDSIHKQYKLEIHMRFGNLYIYRPKLHENTGASNLMYPMDARLRNFTYNSDLAIDLEIETQLRY